MDDADMMPAQKKRRLSRDTANEIRFADASTALASHVHDTERVYTVTPSASPRHVEEAHVHIHRRSTNTPHEFNFFPRQDTSSSSLSSSSSSSSSLSSTTTDSSSASLGVVVTTTNSNPSTPLSSSSSSISFSNTTGSSSQTSSITSSSVTSTPGNSSSTSSFYTAASTPSLSSNSSITNSSVSTTSSSSSTSSSLSSSSSSLSSSSSTSSLSSTSSSTSTHTTSTATSTSGSSTSSATHSTTHAVAYVTYTTTQTQDGLDGKVQIVTSTIAAGDYTPNGLSATTSATSSSVTDGALAVSGKSSNNSSTPPAGTIAGGVVGGAAGLAVVVLIGMLFVRWYRRRSKPGNVSLPPDSTRSPDVDEGYAASQGPGMAERAGLMTFGSAVPTFLRHQNRSVEDSEPSERGFTRVSGRKLPSAFSEGMSSPPPSMPLRSEHSRNFSSGAPTFYRDNADPFYGEPGDDWTSTSPTSGFTRSQDHELMTMSPGPRRTPTVHHATQDFYRPPRRPSDARFGGSPAIPGNATRFARSDTPSTIDPSRNSRFTEEM